MLERWTIWKQRGRYGAKKVSNTTAGKGGGAPGGMWTGPPPQGAALAGIRLNRSLSNPRASRKFKMFIAPKVHSRKESFFHSVVVSRPS